MNAIQQEQIEDFLDNNMSTEAYRAFEVQIAQNKALKSEVDLERFVRKGLKALALKDAFRAMHHSIYKSPIVPMGQNKQRKAGVFRVQQDFRWLKTYYAAACLAMVTFGLSYWYYWQPSSEAKTRNTLALVKPYNIKPTAIIENKNTAQKTELKVDKQIYANSQPPAQDFLNEQEQTHLLSYSQIPIDLALSPAECEALFKRYFNENDFEEASLKNGIEAMIEKKNGLAIFQEIVTTATNDNLRQKAQWLATLAFLKNCNTVEALRLANSIRQSNAHQYQNQAERLYVRLR